MLHVYTDGGSRGNPGPAALGVAMSDGKGKTLAAFGKTLGVATNNVAEYSAVIAAYEWLLAHPEALANQETVHFFLDSELVVSQLTGRYRIKSLPLLSLYRTIKEKEKALTLPVTYTHVPRAKNKEADRQVNIALDNPS